MSMISVHATSENPRIIYDLLFVYACLCKDFSPDIQTTHHATLMTVIMKGLKNNLTKVQFRAVQAVVDFARPLLECEEERAIMTNYTPVILSEIAQLFTSSLKNGPVTLLEETLLCVSTICATIDTEFSKFYPDFMTGMINLLSQIKPDNPTSINVRILAIECIGYFLNSVRLNKELFNTDSHAVMEFLI